MRIGLETLSCDRATGIGRIVCALSEAISARGHDVHILAQDTGPSGNGMHMHRVRGFARSKAISKLLFRAGARRSLRRLDCDVTYSFGVGRGADVVAAQSCHRAGMDLLEPHALAAWEHPNVGLYDLVSLSDEKALMTSPSTRKIIACSQLVKNQIVQYYDVEPDRITVIPNGITPQRDLQDDASRATVRMRYGISEQEKMLLFMGNEFARKGLRTVLEAMARLSMPELRLVVAGAGNAAPFQRLTGALRLNGKVNFLGRVEQPETFFRAADMFVFPTLYEPFGMVVLEAMAAGLPVITSRSCGAVEGMTNGLHGIFLDDPTSAGDLAEMIARVLTDEALSAKLSDAGKKIAHQFCWDTIADRTLHVLEHASKERRRQ